MDQAAEESALVNDFVPQQGNLITEGRHAFLRRRFSNIYQDQSSKNYLNNHALDGIVTLGESRSYSVVKKQRKVEKRLLQTNEPTTTTEPTTEELTTTVFPYSMPYEVEPEPVSLLTEDRPYATAVQRSQFSVEEAAHEPVTSSSEKIDYRPSRPVNSQLITSKAAEAFTIVDSSTLSATSSPFRYYPTPNSRSTLDKTDPVIVVENSSPAANPLASPISYRTSLKSATSGSSVSFYREPPNTQKEATTPAAIPTERLKHETRVETVSFHEEVVVPQRPVENHTVVNEEKSYQFTNVHDRSFHHVQVTHLEPSDKKRALPFTAMQSHGEQEKVYGMPEQNYEVEEALSLKTNGRAHGVQNQDKNKFGYVVEGRDFKKYRVEERTSDGFIVGEYGVVRHDDGSLRGVRYTADSTINPRVIYEALVKFLSL